MKNFNGKVIFLDRSDINTDEIIPAKYLTELSKEALKPYCLEDLNLEYFENTRDLANKAVIITKENFGCGSSREHAPWALEQNGINTVIAINFARIFRQNMFNNGMMAIELPEETINKLFDKFANKDAEMNLDFDKSELTITSGNESVTVDYEIGSFYSELVKTGGWIEYADKKY